MKKLFILSSTLFCSQFSFATEAHPTPKKLSFQDSGTSSLPSFSHLSPKKKIRLSEWKKHTGKMKMEAAVWEVRYLFSHPTDVAKRYTMAMTTLEKYIKMSIASGYDNESVESRGVQFFKARCFDKSGIPYPPKGIKRYHSALKFNFFEGDTPTDSESLNKTEKMIEKIREDNGNCPPPIIKRLMKKIDEEAKKTAEAMQAVQAAQAAQALLKLRFLR